MVNENMSTYTLELSEDELGLLPHALAVRVRGTQPIPQKGLGDGDKDPNTMSAKASSLSQKEIVDMAVAAALSAFKALQDQTPHEKDSIAVVKDPTVRTGVSGAPAPIPTGGVTVPKDTAPGLTEGPMTTQPAGPGVAIGTTNPSTANSAKATNSTYKELSDKIKKKELSIGAILVEGNKRRRRDEGSEANIANE